MENVNENVVKWNVISSEIKNILTKENVCCYAKRTLYRLESTAAKKQNMCKTK